MIVTAGLGVRCGALPLRGMGGNSAGASYPIRTSRRELWFTYDPEKFEEQRRIAKDLKRAGERLRFMRVEGEAKKRFDKLAADYTVNGKVDYLEMAFSGDIRHEVDSLLIIADDEEFFLWFT